MRENLSGELHDFVRQRLHSVDEMEALLLLVRSPTRAWSAEEVAVALTRARETMAASLRLLVAKGLIRAHGRDPELTYRYAISDDDDDRLLRDLAEQCERNREPLLDLLAPRQPTFGERVAAAFARKG